MTGEPPKHLADPAVLLLEYLDWYRSVIHRKLIGLDDAQLRGTVLPSGWSPLELLKHLVHMERRWLRWGFEAEKVAEPWGDNDATGMWRVRPQESLPELLAALHEGGADTRRIVTMASLADLGAVGGRFETEADRPTLGWILFHVLQEYSRHAGHLDVVRELIDGEMGE